MKRITIRVPDELWIKLQQKIHRLKIEGKTVAGEQPSLNTFCVRALEQAAKK